MSRAERARFALHEAIRVKLRQQARVNHRAEQSLAVSIDKGGL